MKLVTHIFERRSSFNGNLYPIEVRMEIKDNHSEYPEYRLFPYINQSEARDLLDTKKWGLYPFESKDYGTYHVGVYCKSLEEARKFIKEVNAKLETQLSGWDSHFTGLDETVEYVYDSDTERMEPVSDDEDTQ
jgi:hypothetical protein